jgi:hypothetical protein
MSIVAQAPADLGYFSERPFIEHLTRSGVCRQIEPMFRAMAARGSV